MQQLMQNIDIYLLVAVLTTLSFVLLVLVIVLLVSISKLKNRFNTALRGTEGGQSLEMALAGYNAYVEALSKKHDTVLANINNLHENIKPCIQKVGMVRYNPFDEMGGDLSYALAMLDQENNGFVINTIMTREGSRTYCKPIENSTSEYPLSYEEELSIKRATGLEDKTPRGKKARGYN